MNTNIEFLLRELISKTNGTTPATASDISTLQSAIVSALADLPNIELNTDNININVQDLEVLLTATNVLLTSINTSLLPVSRTLFSSIVTSSGTVSAGNNTVSFTTNSTFVGTINGVVREANTQYSFSAPNKDTLGAIPYTISSGSITIDRY